MEIATLMRSQVHLNDSDIYNFYCANNNNNNNDNFNQSDEDKDDNDSSSTVQKKKSASITAMRWFDGNGFCLGPMTMSVCKWEKSGEFLLMLLLLWTSFGLS